MAHQSTRYGFSFVSRTMLLSGIHSPRKSSWNFMSAFLGFYPPCSSLSLNHSNAPKEAEIYRFKEPVLRATSIIFSWFYASFPIFCFAASSTRSLSLQGCFARILRAIPAPTGGRYREPHINIGYLSGCSTYI